MLISCAVWDEWAIAQPCFSLLFECGEVWSLLKCLIIESCLFAYYLMRQKLGLVCVFVHFIFLVIGKMGEW